MTGVDRLDNPPRSTILHFPRFPLRVHLSYLLDVSDDEKVLLNSLHLDDMALTNLEENTISQAHSELWAKERKYTHSI